MPDPREENPVEWTPERFEAAFDSLVAHYGDRPEPAPEVSTESSFLDLPEEHFEPDNPPPLPHPDRVGRFAWAGVLGGPGVLVGLAITGYSGSGWLAPAAVASFVAGFVTLVARSKGRDSDDDGAVV